MRTGQHLLKKIFISHSAADKRFVRQLARRIQQVGFQVWLDEHELLAGDRLSESIAAALAEAKVILVVVSPVSVKSKWLRYELNLAAERMIKGDCRVIPVVIGDCLVPSSLDGLLYADFRPGFSKGFKAISAALQHEAARAAKAAGFWAQAHDLVDHIFGGRGFAWRNGEFDTRQHDIVSVPVPSLYGPDTTVVYDQVRDHLGQRRPIAEEWWIEYTQLRKDNDEDLYLVVSERPVEVPGTTGFPPGNCVQHRTFEKNIVAHETGHVVFADLSGVRGDRGRKAILRAARERLIALGNVLSVPASA
jgi:hypothetical protein